MYIDLSQAGYFFTFGIAGAIVGSVLSSLAKRSRRASVSQVSETEEGAYDREIALKAVLRCGLANTGDEVVAQAKAFYAWLHHGK